jgi:pimeloyl-ACP methyl ester carboxylesterase
MQIANKLKNRFRCTLIDLYGFGKSIHPNYPLNLKDYTNAVKEIIDHYYMSNIIIIGHSFGGRIAIQYCTMFSNVDKLILIDSAGIKPHRNFKYYFKLLKYQIRKKLNLKDSHLGSIDYKSLNCVMKQTFVNIVNFNQKLTLKNIKIPTLIIWGEEDKETPLYMAKILNRKIKKSKLCIIKDAGHFSFIDDFISFNNCLTGFLN